MSFNRVLGQETSKQIIDKALRNGRIAPAYLFYGPESIGKKLMALELAKALNCEDSGPTDACGECSSCRKIDQRIHPDFFFLEPTKASSSARDAAIKIDEIRNLQKKMGYLPYEGKTKVAIIDGAEKMNEQASNSFLKTLEEPPSSTVLILIASNPYQLLPTIISRCQGIKFSPLPDSLLRQIVREQAPDMDSGELELRVLRSAGQVQRALDENIAVTEQYRNDLLEVLGALSFDRMDLVFQCSKTWARQSDEIQNILDELLGLLRDLAFMKTGCDSSCLLNSDIVGKLKPLSGKSTMRSLLKKYDAVQQTKTALMSNANKQLFLENMLLNFCEAA